MQMAVVGAKKCHSIRRNHKECPLWMKNIVVAPQQVKYPLRQPSLSNGISTKKLNSGASSAITDLERMEAPMKLSGRELQCCALACTFILCGAHTPLAHVYVGLRS